MEIEQFVKESIEKINEMGYDTEITTAYKNGLAVEHLRVTKKGEPYGASIAIESGYGRVNGDVDKFVEWVTSDETMNTGKEAGEKFQEILTDKQKVLDHVKLFLRGSHAVNKDRNEYHKNVLGDMDEYCRIVVNFNDDSGVFSTIITKEMIEPLNISDDDLWMAAKKNTFTDEDFVIMSMNDTLMSIMKNNMPEEEVEEALQHLQDTPTNMYVLSNKSKTNGAIQVMNKRKLAEWMKNMQVKKAALIPSSLHEVILFDISNFEEFDENAMNCMIGDVNQTQLPPCDILSYKCHVFSYNEEDDSIIRLL